MNHFKGRMIIGTKALLLMTLISAMNVAKSIEDSVIPGYEFGLSTIEKQCIAIKHSQMYGSIECKDQMLKVVERKCEILFEKGLADSELICRGDLRVIQKECRIEMHSAKDGSINCKLG